MHAGAHIVGQTRRGRFLDDLLVTTLGGTVPFAQGSDAAFAVAEKLHFNMAGMLHEFLEKHAIVAEVVLAEALY